MKNAEVVNTNVDDRIRKVVNDAMTIYINKLINGFIEVGLEATFQLHLSKIIDDLLRLNTFEIDERFQIFLENNIPIKGAKKYVDIMVRFTRNQIVKDYLVELKFKKITDSATDTGNISSYIDMCNLDYYLNNNSNICGCYFIFLTDCEGYIKKPRKGTTRDLVPMHDMANIKAGLNYNVTGNAAKTIMGSYLSSGFVMTKDHTFEYNKFSIKSKDYWCFVEEI